MTAGKITATWRGLRAEAAGLASDPEVMAEECGFTDRGSRAASKLLRQEVVEGASLRGP